MSTVTTTPAPVAPVIGIEHIKTLVKAGLNFGQDIAGDLADGKISIMEIFGLTPDLFAIINSIKGWADIKAELKNVLTPAEIADLAAFVMTNFNVPSAKVNTFVGHALSTVVGLVSLVDEFKHIKDPVTAP